MVVLARNPDQNGVDVSGPKPRARLISLISVFVLAGCIGLGCSPSGGTPAFDEKHAFTLLEKQVGFGPRYPGVPGHSATADWVFAQLKPYADEVRVQRFSHTAAGQKLELRNIIARFNAAAPKVVLLAAHWDTRPLADMEVDRDKRAQPVPGANDGASGVAVLLELARMFAKQKPDVGVVMVFFDGEDYTAHPPSSANMFLGSKYYARHLEHLDSKTKQSIKYGILLDMVGDKNLRINPEMQSVEAAPEVVKLVWGAAKSLGYAEYFPTAARYSIADDHVPLIAAGVKCIDVIDFDYAYWHTLDDTVDKCAAKSLKVVGDVVARVVYQEKTQ